MNHPVYVSTSGVQVKNALQLRQLRMSKSQRSQEAVLVTTWTIGLIQLSARH
jgi:hypothetical protein